VLPGARGVVTRAVALIGYGFIGAFNNVLTPVSTPLVSQPRPQRVLEISINFLNCQTIFPHEGNGFS
jgi:hypothetical protein